MGKGATSLTNSLYKINDKIAQARNSAPLPGVPEVPEQQVIPTDTKKPEQLSSERIQEFNRMYHDLEIRTEGMISEYQAEIELLNGRIKDLSNASQQVEKLKQELQSFSLPGEKSEAPERELSKTLRALELMRLETVRLTKKMDSAKTAASGSAAEQRNQLDLMNIPNSEIAKKGFAFFFPLFLALLFCTVLMGLAFIFAWKVAL